MDIHGVSIRMQLLVNLALSQNIALAKLDKNKSTVKTNLIKFKVGIVAAAEAQLTFASYFLKKVLSLRDGLPRN